jgi:hypothetical protein
LLAALTTTTTTTTATTAAAIPTLATTTTAIPTLTTTTTTTLSRISDSPSNCSENHFCLHVDRLSPPEKPDKDSPTKDASKIKFDLFVLLHQSISINRGSDFSP